MIYPFLRRLARRAGIYMTTNARSQSYPLTDDEHNTDGNTGGKSKSKSMGMSQASRKKRFRHPLSIPDTQWRDESTTVGGSGDDDGYGDEVRMLDLKVKGFPSGKNGLDKDGGRFGREGENGSLVTSGQGSYDERERDLEGIKVVRETIVERK